MLLTSTVRVGVQPLGCPVCAPVVPSVVNPVAPPLRPPSTSAKVSASPGESQPVQASQRGEGGALPTPARQNHSKIKNVVARRKPSPSPPRDPREERVGERRPLALHSEGCHPTQPPCQYR